MDANILIYAVGHGGEKHKHGLANELLDHLSAAQCGILPLHALTQFYAVAPRKDATTPTAAAAFVETMAALFPVLEAVLADTIDAMRVHRDHNIPFWDGMI